MFYIFISIVAPLLVYGLFPIAVELLTHKRPTRDAYLLIACLVYCLSWYLPSPLIYGEDTAFTTHFVGGGIFTGILWLYTKRQLQLKLTPLQEIATLYGLVCALGVANELFELAISQLHLVQNLNGADTWWDLLANTLGATTFWIVYKLSTKATK